MGRNKVRLLIWGSVAVLVLAYAGMEYSYRHRYESPQTALEYHSLGKKCIQQNNFSEAEEYLNRAIELDPDLGKAYMDLAVVYNEYGYLNKAVEYSEKALPLMTHPLNIEILYFNLGELYTDLKQPEQAWEYYRKSYEMNSFRARLWPKDPPERLQYVMDDDREAFVKKVKNRQVPPKAYINRIDRINDFIDQKKQDDAIKEIMLFLEQNPDSDWADWFRIHLIRAYHQNNQLDEALEQVDILQSRDLSENDQALLNYFSMFVYKDSKEYEKAARIMDEVRPEHLRDYSPDEVQYNQSLLLQDMGDYDRERQVLNKIVGQKSKDRFAFDAIRRLYEMDLIQGRYRQAYENMITEGFLVFLYSGLVISVGFAFIMTIVFFAIHRIFFLSTVPKVRKSPFRLWHFFLFLAFIFVCQPFLETFFLEFNYNVFPVLNRLQLNPQIFSQILTELFMVALIIYILKDRYRVDSRVIGLSIRSRKTAILAPMAIVLSMIAAAIVYGWIMQLFGIAEPPESMMQKQVRFIHNQGNPGQIFLIYLIIVLIGPLAEEMLYRVFLIRFTQKYTNVVFAVILSSFLFGISHEPPILMPLMCIYGVIFSLGYLWTKSIIPGILAHALYNLLVSFDFIINGGIN